MAKTNDKKNQEATEADTEQTQPVKPETAASARKAGQTTAAAAAPAPATQSSPVPQPVSAQPNLPEPYDPFWPPEIGLMQRFVDSVDAVEGTPPPPLASLCTILKRCIELRSVEPDDVALVRAAFLELTLQPPDDAFAASMSQMPCMVRVIEADGEDLKRAVCAQNYLLVATDALASLQSATAVTAPRSIYAPFPCQSALQRASGSLSSAQSAVQQVMVRLVSCGCSGDVRASVHELNRALREVENECCMLMCEIGTALFIDTSMAIARQYLVEMVSNVRSAAKQAERISGASRNSRRDVEALRLAIRRLQRYGEPEAVRARVERMSAMADQLSEDSLESDSSRRLIEAIMDDLQDLGRQLDSSCCPPKLDLLPVAQRVFQLECSLRKPPQDPHQKSRAIVEELITEVMPILLKVKPDQQQQETLQRFARGVHQIVAAPLAEAEGRHGFDLLYPEEVARVTARSLITGEIHEGIVRNGNVSFDWAAQDRVEFVAYNSLGVPVETVVLES